VQCVDVLPRYGFDGNIVDVDLALPDEEKKKIERAFEDLQFDAIFVVWEHAAMLGRGSFCATQNSSAPPTKTGHKKTVAIAKPGPETKKAALRDQTGTSDQGRLFKVFVLQQKGVCNGFVFTAAQGTGGIDEKSARGDVGAMAFQQFGLKGCRTGDIAGARAPFELRAASPGAGTRTGGVD
jgi:hypothetical protein